MAITRRELMKRAALGAGAVATAKYQIPYVLAQDAKRGKLRTAVIGCGGQGTSSHVPAAAGERLVALIDPDSKNLDKAKKRAKDTRPETDIDAIQTFSDYRVFFDKMKGEVDAVFIATPNHHHALPALLAMQRGIGAYVEKPLCYDINEAKMLAEYAAKYKVATQMGNQGHSESGYRVLCEYIWAGAIGNVTEVHCWSDRANGGTGGILPAQPIPASLDWDKWVGPAPYRDYHKELHPHTWHSWHDYGNGSLGNMGAHVFDGAMWALKLKQPTSVEVEYMLGGSKERYPVGTRLRYEYAAREGMPPVKVFWHDGKKPGSDAVAKGAAGDYSDSVSRGSQNWPAIVEELKAKLGRNFDGSGSVYIGDKGMMYTGTYGGGVRILPEEQHKATPVPEKVLPRLKGTHQGIFLNAVREGTQASAPFDYASQLTSMILVGCLAIKAGPGQTIEWDGEAMRSTNKPEINQYLQREWREGWRP